MRKNEPGKAQGMQVLLCKQRNNTKTMIRLRKKVGGMPLKYPVALKLIKKWNAHCMQKVSKMSQKELNTFPNLERELTGQHPQLKVQITKMKFVEGEKK